MSLVAHLLTFHILRSLPGGGGEPGLHSEVSIFLELVYRVC